MTDQTIIGRGLTITGDVESTGPIVIDGEVDGNVHAASVVVRGRVHGDITATERAELTPDAEMTGDIRAERIVIADGARFSGKVDMHG